MATTETYSTMHFSLLKELTVAPSRATLHANELEHTIRPRKRSAPRIPKLRDSCEACSAAKVRCSKKKPTCMRCEKRNLACEYFHTRRAGRPSQTSTKSLAKITKPSQIPPQIDVSNVFYAPLPHSQFNSMSSEAGLSPSPSLIESSPTQQYMTPDQDSSPDFLSPTDCNAVLSSPPSSLTALIEFDSFGYFPELGMPTQDIFSPLDSMDYANMTMNSSHSNVLISDEAFTSGDGWSDIQIFTDTNTTALPSVVSLSSCMGSEAALVPADVPSCHCMISAMDCLKSLYSKTSISETLTQPIRKQTILGERPAITPRTTQSVITENQNIIEAMDDILQCQCPSQDGYLLAMLSLLVFQLLDRYIIAATMTQTYSLHSETKNSSSHCQFQSELCSLGSNWYIEGEDHARVSTQMVLGELHRVQRVMNKLSLQLTKAPDILSDNQGPWPFSSTMLDHLKADLRKRLKDVSSRVVDMLRRD